MKTDRIKSGKSREAEGEEVSILFPLQRPDTSAIHTGKPAPGSWEVHVRLWNMFRRLLGGTGDLGNAGLEDLLKELLKQGGSILDILEKLTIFGERLDDIDQNIVRIDQSIENLNLSTNTRFKEVNEKITLIQNMLSSGLVRGSTFDCTVSQNNIRGDINLPSGTVFIAYNYTVSITSTGESGGVEYRTTVHFTFVSGGKTLTQALGIKQRSESQQLVGAYLY